MQTEQLANYRTRWKRWLGQKCREDRHTWVDLLNSNWAGWASRVLTKHGVDHSPLGPIASKEKVYSRYVNAISIADMDDLSKLDNLYCENNLQKD